MGVHVKYPLFLSDVQETLIISTDFQEYSNIKLHDNTFSGGGGGGGGGSKGQDPQTDRQGEVKGGGFSAVSERA